MKKVISIVAQDRREADEDRRFDGNKRRADLITERMKKALPKMQRLMDAAANAEDTDDVVRLYRQVYDLIGEAAKNKVACKAGCSHCCYQPAMLSQAEANLIAKEIGRPLAEVETGLTRVDAYTGQPCTFLNEKTGSCRIYASRPMVCRGLYSVAMDAVLCHIIPGRPASVPYLNTREVEKNFNRALTLKYAPDQADVRDWFPKGLNK